MSFTIHRRDGSVLFAAKSAATQREAVLEAVRSGADLSKAYLSGAYLNGADLSKAYLSKADLSKADLSGADLSGAYLNGAYLNGADLSKAYLSGAYLSGAYLSGAYLSGAYLSGAYLNGADLSKADLSKADLSGADLSGADLSGATGYNPLAISPVHLYRYQSGRSVAFKLVNSAWEGPFNGGIVYTPGRFVSEAAADTNPENDCAAGINVATLDWCIREWCPGYRILRVSFAQKDIAAIPNGSDGKFRLFRCKVLDELDPIKLGLVGPVPAP